MLASDSEAIIKAEREEKDGAESITVMQQRTVEIIEERKELYEGDELIQDAKA